MHTIKIIFAVLNIAAAVYNISTRRGPNMVVGLFNAIIATVLVAELSGM